MARPVDIREESGISTFCAGVSFGTLFAVLCVAIVLVKLEMGRCIERQIRITESERRFMRF